ncbi:MAG: permease [Candidatus Paceibacterota bacterium]
MFNSVAEIITSILPVTGKVAGILQYWIYENLKILTILAIVVFFVGFLRSFVSPDKIREYLKGKHSLVGYFLAAVLGVVSPFCSCSTIPIFLGLVSAGVPFGIIITFLFVSPMVNLAAVAVLLGSLGWKLTLAYLIGGIFVAISGSLLMSKLGLEEYLIDFDSKVGEADQSEEEKISLKRRFKMAAEEGLNIFKQIVPYVLLGVTVGSFIHGLVPKGAIESYLSGPFSVPLAVVVGVPIYTNIVGVIPVTQSLISGGLSIGTAIAFMMSVAALSLPQFILLKKAMKMKLIVYYGAILSLGIILLGYFLNFIF